MSKPTHECCLTAKERLSFSSTIGWRLCDSTKMNVFVGISYCPWCGEELPKENRFTMNVRVPDCDQSARWKEFNVKFRTPMMILSAATIVIRVSGLAFYHVSIESVTRQTDGSYQVLSVAIPKLPDRAVACIDAELI